MWGLLVPLPAASGAPPGVFEASGTPAANGFPDSCFAEGFFSRACANPLSWLSGEPELFSVPRLVFFSLLWFLFSGIVLWHEFKGVTRITEIRKIMSIGSSVLFRRDCSRTG